MRYIGAEIRHSLDFEGKKARFAIEGQARLGHMIAALSVAEECFVPATHPFDRPAEPARRPQHQGVFRIDEIFHAEAAADVAHDNADIGWLDAERLGGQTAYAKMAVAIGVQRIAPDRRIEFTERAARFDRRSRHPVVAKLDLDHMFGAGKGGLHRRLIADDPIEGDVAWRFWPELHGAVPRRLRGIHHDRQRRIFDGNPLRRVECLGHRFRHYHGHRLADMADAVIGENGLRRVIAGCAAPPRHLQARVLHRRKRCQAICAHIRAGQNGQYTGGGTGVIGVERDDVGMGVRRTQNDGMDLAGEIYLVLKTARSGEKPRILLAPYRLAYSESRHRCSPRILCSSRSRTQQVGTDHTTG